MSFTEIALWRKTAKSIARIRLRNIRWSAAGVPKVTVNFDVDKTGLLTIGVNNLDRKDEAIVETNEIPTGFNETAHAAEGENAASDAAERERIREARRSPRFAATPR